MIDNYRYIEFIFELNYVNLYCKEIIFSSNPYSTLREKKNGKLGKKALHE
jgi:hypothetical protein